MLKSGTDGESFLNYQEQAGVPNLHPSSAKAAARHNAALHKADLGCGFMSMCTDSAQLGFDMVASHHQGCRCR